MKELRLAIILGQLTRWGVSLAIFLVLWGSALFLTEHGQQSLLEFSASNVPYLLTQPNLIWQAAIQQNPLALIQLGFLVLVGTQVSRVGLVMGFFMVVRDYPFVIISLLVFSLMIYSWLAY